MNKQMIRYTLGSILMVIGGLMVLPVIVSLIYKEDILYVMSFLGTSIGTVLIGYVMTRLPVKSKRYYVKEAFVIVSLAWVFASFFGGLPFVINGDIPNIVDAFFETSSGFTTTGASILTDVEALAHSSLFWRSFTHFIGGMGVLVFVMAILPEVDSSSVHIMRAEMPGPTFGKMVSRLTQIARILYLIYLVMTLVFIILLIIAGAPVFDAILLSFGTAGTGGFGVLNGSVAPYHNLAMELILGSGMILFGVNFTLYYMILKGKVRQVLKSEELKWFLGIILGAMTLITIDLTFKNYGFLSALRDSFFSVSSVISTTGYSTALFDQWPLFSQLILLVIMFVGGMAGSTAGGLKVSRVMILTKASWAELKRTLRPNRVAPIQAEGRRVELETLKTIFSYLVIYIILFLVFTLLVSFETPDFMSAFSAVAATFNNIGPGLGVVGPSGSFTAFSPFIKMVLSFTMIIGRLEILPMLILLSPKTWTKDI